MSEPDDFLARWSRRKRLAGGEAEPATTPPERGGMERAADSERAVETIAPSPKSAEAAFDLTTLPALESITAATDIRAFLAPGVPAELTRAALRRMWASDPQIRDFVGLADYDWDFNAAGSMHGFGPLEMTDALRSAVAQMFSPGPATKAAEAAPDQTQSTVVAEQIPRDEIASKAPEQPCQQDQALPMEEELSGPHALARGAQEPIALQRKPPEDEGAATIAPRRHGGALPK
jgi:hypothetical protein